MGVCSCMQDRAKTVNSDVTYDHQEAYSDAGESTKCPKSYSCRVTRIHPLRREAQTLAVHGECPRALRRVLSHSPERSALRSKAPKMPPLINWGCAPVIFSNSIQRRLKECLGAEKGEETILKETEVRTESLERSGNLNDSMSAKGKRQGTKKSNSLKCTRVLIHM